MNGFLTLLRKEILRFWKVAFQTVAAPVLTSLLYLLIFAHVMSESNAAFPGVRYEQFLIPGLAMMAMLQNAFANTSSSLIQSKITGNIIFILLPPLSHWDFYGAYVIAAIVRAMAVGVGVFGVGLFLAHVPVHSLATIVAFGLLGSGMLAALGIIAGLWAEKFDQLAAFQNFIIMPLTFLAGVFYSIRSLPQFWQELSHLNPFFYMIDGFRHGFFGQSDVALPVSLGITGLSFVCLSAVTLYLLKSGFKLRQ
ncbi:MAG TPA: ABC transporter permease [Usitatibacteraceae bacterium]|nr:ABC transporter permease [Usitatibacteraceae bacterium]